MAEQTTTCRLPEGHRYDERGICIWCDAESAGLLAGLKVFVAALKAQRENQNGQ